MIWALAIVGGAALIFLGFIAAALYAMSKDDPENDK